MMLLSEYMDIQSEKKEATSTTSWHDTRKFLPTWTKTTLIYLMMKYFVCEKVKRHFAIREKNTFCKYLLHRQHFC